ncbi:hypothetical protein QBC38DRAFT_491927 [Podospora fimiseda]|uniref:Uncharacterized protein n=1 Tax=Podospora fimiseda TaxID=252190 RepID=A0AAN6YMZ0_9PEZI|nr:hypothetical protein QBC38DRAFT_491927 [Podospora fimiseda]
MTEVGLPCGQNYPDCPTLTCIPLSSNCTDWSVSPNGCPGTCQYIDYSTAQVYTICGGWGYLDDCDERIEYCTDDPRNMYSCGPSCDDMGICWRFNEYCGNLDGTEQKCPEGKECFRNWTWGHSAGYGLCLPLRFGSNGYPKSRLEEIIRTDQDGYQGDDCPEC